DQLDDQRGAASAAASSAQAVGIVVGVGAIVLLGLSTGASYAVLAGFILVIGTVTAVLLPDPPPPHAALLSLHARRDLTRARISSLVDPSFTRLLISRFIVNVGNALGTSLLLFFLLYGIMIPAADAEGRLLELIVIYTIFVVLASVIVGMVSDRKGNRRLWTVLSALVQASSGVIILISPNFTTTTAVAAGVMGAGYGAYMAVSLALATDLLLDPDDHARDLSLVNSAANLGQLVGPLLGAGLVALVGGFWLLFATAAAASALGAGLTLTVRPRRASLHAPGADEAGLESGLVCTVLPAPQEIPSSFPCLDSSGLVQEVRSNQQGRRLPDSSFEIATSTRRARVSAFFVALIQRTHSQRAIGVRLCHTSSRSPASVRAARRSCGTVTSGQSRRGLRLTATSSPADEPSRCQRSSSMLIQCPRRP